MYKKIILCAICCPVCALAGGASEKVIFGLVLLGGPVFAQLSGFLLSKWESGDLGKEVKRSGPLYFLLAGGR